MTALKLLRETIAAHRLKPPGEPSWALAKKRAELKTKERQAKLLAGCRYGVPAAAEARRNVIFINALPVFDLLPFLLEKFSRAEERMIDGPDGVVARLRERARFWRTRAKAEPNEEQRRRYGEIADALDREADALANREVPAQSRELA